MQAKGNRVRLSRAPCDAHTTAANQPVVHAKAACRQHLQNLAQGSLGLDLCHGSAAEQQPDATKRLPFPSALAQTSHLPLRGANPRQRLVDMFRHLQ